MLGSFDRAADGSDRTPPLSQGRTLRSAPMVVEYHRLLVMK
jgi:hypothetical protein